MNPDESVISRALEQSAQLLRETVVECGDDILSLARMVLTCLQDGGKVLLCGNGGSAADAQHIACELAGRFNMERTGLTAMSLTTNTSTLTAVANDYGFRQVFARQVEALGSPGDLLVAISTSGNSPNILDALEKAKEMGLKTAGLSGKGGGDMVELCDLCVIIPSDSTPRIQEAHITVGHAICDFVERAFFGDKADV